MIRAIFRMWFCGFVAVIVGVLFLTGHVAYALVTLAVVCLSLGVSK